MFLKQTTTNNPNNQQQIIRIALDYADNEESETKIARDQIASPNRDWFRGHSLRIQIASPHRDWFRGNHLRMPK
jgi:hypothetical protein